MMRKGENDGGGGEEERGKNCLQAVFLTVFSPRSLPPVWLYLALQNHKHTKAEKPPATQARL